MEYTVKESCERRSRFLERVQRRELGGVLSGQEIFARRRLNLVDGIVEK